MPVAFCVRTQPVRQVDVFVLFCFFCYGVAEGQTTVERVLLPTLGRTLVRVDGLRMKPALHGRLHRSHPLLLSTRRTGERYVTVTKSGGQGTKLEHGQLVEHPNVASPGVTVPGTEAKSGGNSNQNNPQR